jgi:nucleotide-binding universal stress UspA family protein
MFKKILVPLDGSQLSEAILPHVSELAKSLGAQIVLLRVVPTPVHKLEFAGFPAVPVSPAPPVPTRDLFGEADSYLEAIAYQYFPDQQVTLEVAGGTAGDNILSCADSLEVDLIAMTTHGRSGFSRMVMGSIADEVVRRSHLPVLLLRPPGK